MEISSGIAPTALQVQFVNKWFNNSRNRIYFTYSSFVCIMTIIMNTSSAGTLWPNSSLCIYSQRTLLWEWVFWLTVSVLLMANWESGLDLIISRSAQPVWLPAGAFLPTLTKLLAVVGPLNFCAQFCTQLSRVVSSHHKQQSTNQ